MTHQAIKLLQAGKPHEAIPIFCEALKFKGNDPSIHVNLALAYEDIGELPLAERGYRFVLSVWPKNADAALNLGNLLARLGRTNEAQAIQRQAIIDNPTDAHVGQALAFTQADQGRIEEAVANFRRAAEMMGTADAWSIYLSYRLHIGTDRRGHKDWVQHFARPLYQEPPAVEWDGVRPLRVGYLASTFRQHNVPYFFEPILANHSAAVETFLYCDVRKPDAVTERLKALAGHSRDVARLNDHQLAKAIRSDRLDVLVELDGHKVGNRLLVMARNPAPVLGTMIGYTEDTGLTENFNLGWAYRPSDDAPPITPPPFDRNSFIAFGSFNRACKITLPVAAAWGRIIQAVKGSRLVVASIGGEGNTALRRRLEAAGVPSDALTLQEPLKERADYLRAIGEIDIHLDTFPFNGVATTCDALWQGVPTVTIEGKDKQGQVGAEIMRAIGVYDLVATDEPQYVRRAAWLAEKVDWLRWLRNNLRSLMKPMLDGKPLTARLEALYAQRVKEPRRTIQMPGAAEWKELHTRAANVTDLSGESAWLGRFTARLNGCDCRKHWTAWLTESPPDLSSRDAFFAWTWRAHNAVNVRMGKPEMPLDAARAMYGLTDE